MQAICPEVDCPVTDLTGKVCLVTAAAQGIGRASALAFARAGGRVIATDINAEELATLDGATNIELRSLDVLDVQAVNAAAAAIGRIDVLFNCAGVVHNGTILACSDADLDFALDLNFKAQVRTIKAILPGMLERGDGAIVNMATVASSVKAVPSRVRLFRLEGRGNRADQVGRGRLCGQGHPLQRHLSRHG